MGSRLEKSLDLLNYWFGFIEKLQRVLVAKQDEQKRMF